MCKNQNSACFGFKIGFLKKFLDRSVSFFGQETQEHVKTIKKRCLEAKNDISSGGFRPRSELLGHDGHVHVPTFGSISHISGAKLTFEAIS